MKKMNYLVLILCLVSASLANADVIESWGAEASLIYLYQSSGGGQSTTVLPMINGKVYSQGGFGLVAQVGATAYKDALTDKVFAISVARLNPSYKFEGTPFAIEGLVGVQAWDGHGVNLDTGLRGHYFLQESLKEYFSDVFLQVGTIAQNNRTDYVGVGFSSWF
jgi:opacity protein-like surface antigen